MAENMSDTSMKSAEGQAEAIASNADRMMSKAQDTVDETQARVSERYSAAREKLKEQWAGAREDLDVLKQKAIDYSQTAARATNTFAHDHPWTTAGAAVGVGALIGWLMSRRNDTTQRSSH